MKIKNNRLEAHNVRQGDSPNQGGAIKPRLIVLHYTASGGEDGKGDAEYLSRASARASAHVVVGRNGSIDQIVPFNKRAWHAGVSEWQGEDNVNDFSIGIEIDNWGWLDRGHKTHAGVKIPDEFVFEGTRSGHNFWEKYRDEQLEAVEEVIAAICDQYKIEDIVGHEDIAPGRKQDPGPALDDFMAKMKEKYVKVQTPLKPSKVSGKGKKTTANLNLRKRPTTSSVILTVIPEGKTVEVLSEWNGWSEVRYGNRQAYVSSLYLT